MIFNQSVLRHDLVMSVSHSFLDEKMQSHSGSSGHWVLWGHRSSRHPERRAEGAATSLCSFPNQNEAHQAGWSRGMAWGHLCPTCVHVSPCTRWVPSLPGALSPLVLPVLGSKGSQGGVKAMSECRHPNSVSWPPPACSSSGCSLCSLSLWTKPPAEHISCFPQHRCDVPWPKLPILIKPSTDSTQSSQPLSPAISVWLCSVSISSLWPWKGCECGPALEIRVPIHTSHIWDRGFPTGDSFCSGRSLPSFC